MEKDPGHSIHNSSVGFPLTSTLDIAQLLITCHYEKCKPEWMDGGAKQEAMAEQIKREVKAKAAHRRT